MTYDDLLAAPNKYLHRTDLSEYAPGFVEFANAQICRRVHSANRVVRTELTLGASEFELPTDFIAMVAIPLRYVTPKEMYEHDAFGQSGESRIYTIDGTTLVVAPGGAQSLRVTYRATLPLDADNPTNSMLTKHPDLFTWAVLAEAADYVEDPELEVKYRSKLDEAVRSVNNLHDWGAVA